MAVRCLCKDMGLRIIGYDPFDMVVMNGEDIETSLLLLLRFLESTMSRSGLKMSNNNTRPLLIGSRKIKRLKSDIDNNINEPHIILLTDLPRNILIKRSPILFKIQQLIKGLLNGKMKFNGNIPYPLLICINNSLEDSMILRRLLPYNYMNHPKCLMINLKPITKNKLKSILKYNKNYNNILIDYIVNICYGDIRYAINNLKFYGLYNNDKLDNIKNYMLEKLPPTQYNLIGKLLYNKRLPSKLICNTTNNNNNDNYLQSKIKSTLFCFKISRGIPLINNIKKLDYFNTSTLYKSYPHRFNNFTYNHNDSFINNNTTQDYTNYLPPEVTTNSLRLADSSSTEVQSNSLRPADSSSNYLSLKSRATPRDRGGREGCDGSSIMGMMEDGSKDLLDVTSSGIPVADLREAEGQLNRRATTASGMESREWTSSVPTADLREGKGQLNRRGHHGEWKDKVVTSGGEDKDMILYDKKGSLIDVVKMENTIGESFNNDDMITGRVSTVDCDNLSLMIPYMDISTPIERGCYVYNIQESDIIKKERDIIKSSDVIKEDSSFNIIYSDIYEILDNIDDIIDGLGDSIMEYEEEIDIFDIYDPLNMILTNKCFDDSLLYKLPANIRLCGLYEEFDDIDPLSYTRYPIIELNMDMTPSRQNRNIMIPKLTRPQLYFNHIDILNEIKYDYNTFIDLLFDNYSEYYSNIDDCSILITYFTISDIIYNGYYINNNDNLFIEHFLLIILKSISDCNLSSNIIKDNIGFQPFIKSNSINSIKYKIDYIKDLYYMYRLESLQLLDNIPHLYNVNTAFTEILPIMYTSLTHGNDIYNNTPISSELSQSPNSSTYYSTINIDLDDDVMGVVEYIMENNIITSNTPKSSPKTLNNVNLLNTITPKFKDLLNEISKHYKTKQQFHITHHINQPYENITE